MLNFAQISEMIPKVQEASEKVLAAFARIEAEQQRQRKVLEEQNVLILEMMKKLNEKEKENV